MDTSVIPKEATYMCLFLFSIEEELVKIVKNKRTSLPNKGNSKSKNLP